MSNPKGRRQEDVPRLLRRVAKAIQERGDVEIQDVVFHMDVQDGRDWPTMTVYFHPIDKDS